MAPRNPNNNESTSENDPGDFDGTHTEVASDDVVVETFDYLKVLDTTLEIEMSQKVRVLMVAEDDDGIPYDTATTKKSK